MAALPFTPMVLTRPLCLVQSAVQPEMTVRSRLGTESPAGRPELRLHSGTTDPEGVVGFVSTSERVVDNEVVDADAEPRAELRLVRSDDVPSAEIVLDEL